MAHRGRKLQLTKELTIKICNLLRQGMFRNAAAVSCGIGESTFYRWLELSHPRTETRNGKTRIIRAKKPYVDFREAIELADAESEVLLVQTIRQSAYEVQKTADGKMIVVPRDWQAAKFILQMKHRKNWCPSEDLPELPAGAASAEVTTNRRVVVFGGRYMPDGTLKAPALPGGTNGTREPGPQPGTEPVAAQRNDGNVPADGAGHAPEPPKMPDV